MPDTCEEDTVRSCVQRMRPCACVCKMPWCDKHSKLYVHVVSIWLNPGMVRLNSYNHIFKAASLKTRLQFKVL